VITVLCDVALLLTMVAVEGLRGRGAILLRSIIGFLTLLILLVAENPLILVLRTILPHMVHKLRVLGAKLFLLLGTLRHKCGYVPLLITPIVVYLERLKNWWEGDHDVVKQCSIIKGAIQVLKLIPDVHHPHNVLSNITLPTVLSGHELGKESTGVGLCRALKSPLQCSS